MAVADEDRCTLSAYSLLQQFLHARKVQKFLTRFNAKPRHRTYDVRVDRLP